MSLNYQQYLQEAMPGLVFSSINRFNELKTCLASECDSWTVKFEQVLIHSSFLLGYVSPRQFIWNKLSNLLGGTVFKLGKHFNNPATESDIRMGMSLLEQIGLTCIWDYVRDSSICMRFNNCDNNFLAQVNNIKISTCKLQIDDLRDEKRSISVCEQIFNDSPLIILAFVMILLTIYTSRDKRIQALNFGSSGSNAGSAPPPPAPPQDPGNGRNSGGNAPPPPPPPPRNGHNNAAFKASASFASNIDSYMHPILSYNNRDIPKNNNPAPNSVPSPPKPDPPIQDIDAECPNCKKKFTCSVPKPWTLCCAQILSSIKKRDPCKTARKKDTAAEKVIKDQFKDIKCCHCKDKLKKELKKIKSKKKKKTNKSKPK